MEGLISRVSASHVVCTIRKRARADLLYLYHRSTLRTVLDFFPELREDRHWSESYDDYQDDFDSMDEDAQGNLEDYGTPIGPGVSEEDDGSSSLPHYEVSASQTSMFQTPRQAGAGTSRQPPARKHVDARFYSYPDMQQPKKHHHHHHRHHHHHHRGSTQAVNEDRRSRSTLRPGRSSTARHLSNAGSAVSSVLVGDQENVDDLFAYDAGDSTAGPSGSSYVHHAYAGPSTATEDAHQNQLHVGGVLANHMSHTSADDTQQVKCETPEVKAEEEEVEYENM